MGYKRAAKKAYFEEYIQKAIISWKNKKFSFIRATAIYFQVPLSILKARIVGRKTKA